jgi:hypothetical protein
MKEDWLGYPLQEERIYRLENDVSGTGAIHDLLGHDN